MISSSSDGLFIVWNPGASVLAKTLFARQAQAFETAQALAKNQGGEFFVLKAVGRVRRHDYIETERL